jgi:hypothetical protein
VSSVHTSEGSSEGSDLEREDEAERDRYRELLEELRTIIPGVQVLFAFLLTAPFSSRFEELDELGRNAYAAALLGAALATVVFLTPAALHRIGGSDDLRSGLRIGIACTVIGLILLSAAIVTSVFVVIRFVFDDGVIAEVLAVCVGVVTFMLWYGVSLMQRVSGSRRSASRRPS